MTMARPAGGQSLRTWFRRMRFNFFPAFRATGARVTWIAEDMRALRIKLPLNIRTRNIHGTLFGGAMYAATDPLYAILIKVGLGPGYVIWDKVGAIRYRKPGRSTLYAECRVTEEDLAELRAKLQTQASVDVEREIELVDEAGVVHATVRKTIYVARKEAHRARLPDQHSRATGAAASQPPG
jgi:acyl-coenzyme A thioesterase PaaI-like protein